MAAPVNYICGVCGIAVDAQGFPVTQPIPPGPTEERNCIGHRLQAAQERARGRPIYKPSAKKYQPSRKGKFAGAHWWMARARLAAAGELPASGQDAALPPGDL